MMGMKLKIGRNIVFDSALDRVHRFAGADAGAVADAKDMRVHGLRRLPPPHVQHHVGRLAPHTRQRLQRRAGIWHLAAIVIDQNTAQLDDVLCLLAEQADRLDVLDQPLFTQIQHLLRGVCNFEQIPRRLVDARIGRLCRQRHGHDQSVDIHMLQLALGFGVGLVKARKDLADRVVVELFCHPGLNAVHAQAGKGPRARLFCIGPLVRRLRNGMARRDAQVSGRLTPRRRIR